jgi:Ca-activated chloride channel family protein
MRLKLGLLAVVCALAAAGCTGFDGGFEASGGYSGSGGDFGATPGGVQDMGLARELIGKGRVPPAEAFNVEGMFSEHDLPLEGERCSTTLCLRGAMGIAPDEDEESSAWLQVGFSSTIDPETFQRPSLTIMATVDISGSMTGTPLDVSKAMMHALIDELRPTDSFGIVTYGSTSEVAFPVTPVTDVERLHAVVDGLSTDGSTNMEAGLRTAFGHLAATDGTTDLRRVWLFTDVQPNVGASTASEFETIVGNAADEGIGLTVFGVGLGLGQQVMIGMSHLRGGNAFSIFSAEDVEDLMAESWPWMACPIAYDLSMSVSPADGLTLAEAYGIPAADDSEDIGLEIASVFLSRKRGAILLRFLGVDGTPLSSDPHVELSLSYTSIDGESFVDRIVASVSAHELDDRGIASSQPSVRKTIALAVLVRAMRSAAEVYGDDQEAAVAIMERATTRIEADAAALSDEALETEVQLSRDLLALMQEGAEQGDLYSPSGY